MSINHRTATTPDVDGLITELELDYLRLATFPAGDAGRTIGDTSPTHVFDQDLTTSCCMTL